MRCNKKAFSLFELLLVLFLSSIVITYSFIFTKEVYESQVTNTNLAILKLDLNSTKIIIEKNIKDIDKIYLKENTLYFDENILLENVEFFSKNFYKNILEININLANKISQKWKFKL